MRKVEYASGAPDQSDSGAEVTLHHRFADSNFGLGVRAGMIWLDDAYDTLTIGNNLVAIEDTITEVGFVVNYFFWDHGDELSADVAGSRTTPRCGRRPPATSSTPRRAS